MTFMTERKANKMQSIYRPSYSLLRAMILQVIGAILWVSGINWAIWTIILTHRESPFFPVFEGLGDYGTASDSTPLTATDVLEVLELFRALEDYGSASDFTPLLAVAITLSILVGVFLHLLGAGITRNAIIDLDKASKQMESNELEELRERLAQAEQKLEV